MNTLFDVKDVIEFTAIGRIKEYSAKATNDGYDDCYVIYVPFKKEGVRIYLSSKDLIAMNAKKVVDHGTD